MIGTSENVKKGSILAAMFVLPACLVAVAFSQHSSTETSGDEGRIRRVVREAKARGDTEVALSPPIPLPTGVSSVDEVVALYSIVIVEPVQTLVSLADPDAIETWCKLKVLEWLVRQKMTDDEPRIPSALLPVPKDELVVVHSGGKAIIDGVTVTEQSYDNLSFKTSRKYLLFVLLSRRAQYADLAAGSSSAFLVRPDDTLEPLTRLSYPLVDDVRRVSGGVLSVFREAVRSRLDVECTPSLNTVRT